MIKIDQLRKSVARDKAKLHKMESDLAYDQNKIIKGKVFQYVNKPHLVPWLTFIKVIGIDKRTPNSPVVVCFELNLENQFIYFEGKRKIDFIGEEITAKEFEKELAKFNLKVKTIMGNL